MRPAPALARACHKVFGDDGEHIISGWLIGFRSTGEDQSRSRLGGTRHREGYAAGASKRRRPWNCRGLAAAGLGRFNGFLKSVFLRVSEARDLGDMDRFVFYDHMKTYTAAPPDVLRVDEKNLRDSVLNCQASSSLRTTASTASIFPPTIAGTSSRGPALRRTTSPTILVEPLGLVRQRWRSSCCHLSRQLDITLSTRKRLRRRPRLSGHRRRETGPRRTRNSLTYSTRSAILTR